MGISDRGAVEVGGDLVAAALWAALAERSQQNTRRQLSLRTAKRLQKTAVERLQADLVALAGGGDDQFPAALRHLALGLLDHRRDFFVGVIGIVMEES